MKQKRMKTSKQKRGDPYKKTDSTFPLAIYGCIDSASRKLLWLRIWVSNSDPKIIGRWYLDYLYESRILPSILRLDKGTETGIMATMQAFLHRNHRHMDPGDTVIYGPSTSNQVSAFCLVKLTKRGASRGQGLTHLPNFVSSPHSDISTLICLAQKNLLVLYMLSTLLSLVCIF